MAISIEAKIVAGLLARFGEIALPQGVTVAYPNIDFTPASDGSNNPLPYVRLSVRKNRPSTIHIGGGREPVRMGLILAVVCWPVGKGIIAASELAGTIRDHFAFATRFDYDGITFWIVEEPVVNDDMQGPVYTEIPVVIPWQVYP